jgi:hypothetical protein
MNRNKLNIKMDLLRVSKTALDIKNDFDTKISEEFLNKAREEFSLIEDEDKMLLNDLITHQKQINDIKNDPLKRIRWGEKIMTIASRLNLN